jgi:FRG domain
MARIVTRAYRDWDEFMACLRPELFEDEPFAADRYLFRGVADADWRLVSSFDRQFAGVADPQDVSASLARAFRARCDELADPALLLDDERLLALGQHYGLPTRLLDWTFSPYIAAFFALSGVVAKPRELAYSAVWALHLDAPIWHSLEAGVSIVSPAGNVRLRNQSGCFTRALGAFSSLDEYVDEAEDPGVALTKFVIPARDAERGLAQLRLMGITAAQLFPDLEGAARAAVLDVRLAWEPHPIV